MINDFFGKCKSIIKDTLQNIKGSTKRKILAKMAKEYGKGGQRFIAKELNIGRDTIRRGEYENSNAISSEDAFNLRGRKKSTEILLNLENDIREIVNEQTQIDPKFQSTRVYTRMTVKYIRKELIKLKNYTEEDLPSNSTLNGIINNLGYNLKRIQKVKPLKKLPETNEIFENLASLHRSIKDIDTVIRLSIDTKDKVKIGKFSRYGKSRVELKAYDHDFGCNYVTPFGILNVKDGDVNIYIANGFVSADFIVDRINDYLIKLYENKQSVELLVINADNGLENSSIRTQYIKRMVELSDKFKLPILLAYYPPYHSKYNPIEHVWGTLEQHWNGSLLDSKKAVTEYCKTMTWKGRNPAVYYVNKEYSTGVKLTNKEMKKYNSKIIKKEGLEKWFVLIRPDLINTSSIELTL